MLVGFDATSVAEESTGIENYAFFLAQTLPKIDLRNRYAIFARRGLREAITWPSNVEIVECKGGRFLAQHIQLVMAAGKRNPMFVHFPAFPPPPTIRTRTVITIHDGVVWKFPQTVTARSRLYFDLLYRLAARRASAIVTDSHSSKADIIANLSLPDRKVRVIYPGVGEHFTPISAGPGLEAARARYNLPEKFIFFAGTFEPRKNIPNLIASFNRFVIATDNQDLWLVLVGRLGWGERDVNAAVLQSPFRNRIKVLGYVPMSDLVCLYSLARAFVYPSLYEGFGLPPLEAMACGTPTLVSNTPPFPEITRGAALLVDPRSVEELARGLERVCFDKAVRTRLSREGREVAGSYKWEKTAANLIELYEELFA